MNLKKLAVLVLPFMLLASCGQKAGLLLKETYYDAAGNKTSENVYTYDKEGKQTQVDYFDTRFGGGDELTQSGYHTYEYNDKGLMSSESYFKYDSVKMTFVGDYKNDHTYNDKGLETKTDYYYLVDGVWDLDHYYTYDMDSSDRLIKYSAFRKNDETGEMYLRNRVTYSYRDANEVPSVVHYEDKVGNEWVYSAVEEYYFDDKGDAIERVYSEVSGGIVKPTLRTKTTYVDHREVLSEVFYNISDDQPVWEISDINHTEYDEKGNIICFESTWFFDGIYDSAMRNVAEFDKNGKITREEMLSYNLETQEFDVEMVCVFEYSK